MSASKDLRSRPIKSLAWLGDAIYELELRRRLLAEGDFHPRDLDKMGAALARAECQAEILAAIRAALDEEEQRVTQRAKNASIRSGGRANRNTKDYRQATALEALVAHWKLSGPEGSARMDDLLAPELQSRVLAQVTAFRAQQESKRRK